eukprot:380896-Amorphochlora_amoeboformis.AAC.3
MPCVKRGLCGRPVPLLRWSLRAEERLTLLEACIRRVPWPRKSALHTYFLAFSQLSCSYINGAWLSCRTADQAIGGPDRPSLCHTEGPNGLISRLLMNNKAAFGFRFWVPIVRPPGPTMSAFRRATNLVKEV